MTRGAAPFAFAVAVGVAVAGAAAAFGAAPASVPACAELSGTFARIAGSEGAGNVSYRLRLRNESQAACAFAGLRSVVLLDRQGKKLPSAPELPARTRIVLGPGDAAVSEGRFSPSVPGPGEPDDRPCQRTAGWLQVTVALGRAAVTIAVLPPTRVCSSGRIAFRAFAHRRAPTFRTPAAAAASVVGEICPGCAGFRAAEQRPLLAGDNRDPRLVRHYLVTLRLTRTLPTMEAGTRTVAVYVSRSRVGAPWRLLSWGTGP